MNWSLAITRAQALAILATFLGGPSLVLAADRSATSASLLENQVGAAIIELASHQALCEGRELFNCPTYNPSVSMVYLIRILEKRKSESGRKNLVALTDFNLGAEPHGELGCAIMRQGRRTLKSIDAALRETKGPCEAVLEDTPHPLHEKQLRSNLCVDRYDRQKRLNWFKDDLLKPKKGMLENCP